MKQISSILYTALFSTAVLVLSTGCQKEQSASVTEEAVTASEEAKVTGMTGTSGKYAGSVSQSYADALAANYIKKYGNDDRQTQSVAFSASDLISFLSGLKTKYKSDIIYVNFGVYGKGAAPVNAKDWGRLTVFFTGNKIPLSSGNRRNDGEEDTSGSDFLNHGQMVP